MKTYLYTLLFASLAATNAQAGPVDLATAKKMAQKYIASPVSVDNAPAASMGKGKQATAEEPALYLFNNDQGKGFVIVAADDRVGGVLGYSDRGQIDTQNMPVPLKELLDSYAQAVEAVRVDSISVMPHYAKPPKAFVEPLVSTQWSQEYPYNYYTPRSSQSGKATYTGCVITAAAQILAAHKWPKKRPVGALKGEGAMSYDYYDWDNMLNNYSNGGYNDAQAQAVGALMRDLGYFAKATYGVNGTQCNENYLWYALRDNYDCTVRQLDKDILPGGQFVQAIYNELSMGCPAYIQGGDHAFLYDGYDENGLVHVNWGWNGEFDGYYDINTAATTGGGYGSDGQYYEHQLALFIHPNNGVIEPLSPKPVVLSVNNNEGLQFKASDNMTTSSNIPAQLKGVGARNLAQGDDGAYTGQIGIGLFAQDGTCLHVFGITGELTWATYFTTYNYEYDFWSMNLGEIEGPANGTYYLRPLGCRLLNKATGEYGNWTLMVNGNTVPMVVNNGKVTLIQADNKPHLQLVGKPEVLSPAYEYSSELAGISLNIANLSRYQARGEAQVVLTGTGSLEGETYTVPNAYLTHMVAQRMDTTQWILKFMTSYTGTNGSQALKAGKYKMSLKFNHNIETENPAIYDIALPEDFELEVLPSSYENRVTITSVKLLDNNGAPAASNYFDPEQTPTVSLGISGYSKNLIPNSFNTSIRYRLVNTATGATTYTSDSYKVSIPRNNETNLASSTRHTIKLSQLGSGTYEVHVDVKRDGEWQDRWNANSPRRKFVVYTAAVPTSVQVNMHDAEQIQGVERIATFSAPFNAAVPQGVKAWYVQSVDGSKAKLTAVPDGYAIPAGQGVLLTSSRFIDTFVMEQAPASTPVAGLTNNRLHGSADKAYAISSADNAYVLSTFNGETAFYRAKVGSNLPQYRAFLQWDSTLEALAMDFAGEVTSIKEAGNISVNATDAIYGIDGRTYAPNNAHGLYIVNGKKTIRKP